MAGFRAAFPGDVAPGHVRWGCSYGNGDVEPNVATVVNGFQHQPHEAIKPVGIHRKFYGPNFDNTQVDAAISHAAGDLAAGRLPWLSFKMANYGWQAMGAGSADATLDRLFNGLKTLPGPVWVTMHHEPDDEFTGSAPNRVVDWQAMQTQTRARMDATNASFSRGGNVALIPIFMWWSFQTGSGAPTGFHVASDAWFVSDRKSVV